MRENVDLEFILRFFRKHFFLQFLKVTAHYPPLCHLGGPNIYLSILIINIWYQTEMKMFYLSCSL